MLFNQLGLDFKDSLEGMATILQTGVSLYLHFRRSSTIWPTQAPCCLFWLNHFLFCEELGLVFALQNTEQFWGLGKKSSTELATIRICSVVQDFHSSGRPGIEPGYRADQRPCIIIHYELYTLCNVWPTLCTGV